MTLIWTKSKQPLSVAIRGILQEPVSHFGIVFDNGIVFHSNLLGSHVEWYGTFKKKCDIVYSLEFNLKLEQEEQVYQDILNTYDDKPYDFGALFYFAFRAIISRITGKGLPKTNEFQSADKFLCTELAGCLPDYIVSKDIKSQDLSIVTPYGLYLQISAENQTEKQG